jgi:hypothetical protein
LNSFRLHGLNLRLRELLDLRTIIDLREARFSCAITGKNDFSSTEFSALVSAVSARTPPAHSLHGTATIARPISHPHIPDQGPGHPPTPGTPGEHLINACRNKSILCGHQGQSGIIKMYELSSLNSLVYAHVRECARHLAGNLNNIILCLSLLRSTAACLFQIGNYIVEPQRS